MIAGTATLTYSKVGPYFYGLEGSHLTSALTNSIANSLGSFTGFVWGSFDATTNAPKLFPADVSISDLEWLVLQGSSGVSTPFAIPQLNTTTGGSTTGTAAGGGGSN